MQVSDTFEAFRHQHRALITRGLESERTGLLSGQYPGGIEGWRRNMPPGGSQDQVRRYVKMGAIRTHHTDTTSKKWDGSKTEARIPNDASAGEMREAFAWEDPDSGSTEKAAYKFIHHEVDSKGNIGDANIRAATSGIGVLNGARGGADIPDKDRQAVYKHLAEHVRDSGNEPPELKK
jgi:hypothetical protein